MTMPAAMRGEQRRAIREPVRCAAPKPATAPIAIMPSTPRLRTPERSTTSSPMAASSKGVEAVMMVG